MDEPIRDIVYTNDDGIYFGSPSTDTIKFTSDSTGSVITEQVLGPPKFVDLDTTEAIFNAEIASEPLLGVYGLRLERGTRIIGIPVGDNQFTMNAGVVCTSHDFIKNTFLKDYVQYLIGGGTHLSKHMF